MANKNFNYDDFNYNKILKLFLNKDKLMVFRQQDKVNRLINPQKERIIF